MNHSLELTPEEYLRVRLEYAEAEQFHWRGEYFRLRDRLVLTVAGGILVVALLAAYVVLR